MAEYDIQVACLEYVNAVYPDVIYRTDLAGVRLPMSLAIKAKRSQKFRGYPDISIDHAVPPFHGLKVELKQPGDVFSKSGDTLLSKNVLHHIEQAAILVQLAERGYAVDLALGYDDFVLTIDAYMSAKLPPLGRGSLEKVIDLSTPAQIEKAVMASTGFVTDAILFMAANYRRS